MFEKFQSENVESFRQRYEGTFGFFRNGGPNRLLVKLSAISNERVDFVDSRGISYHVNPDHPENVGFEFVPPKSQWYNTPLGAMYTQRLATRQFQRGVTSKTIEISLLVKGVPHPVRVDFDNLSLIYEQAIRPRDAYKRISELKKEVSFAISGQFALGSQCVYLLKDKIGEYTNDGDTFNIKLNEPELWRTEILDAMKAIGANAQITGQ